MGRRDARRLGLVQAALQGKITSREGAEALGLSVRHFKRLRSRVRRQGARGLVHGNRGRPSPRRLAEATRRRIQELLTGPVKINDHHLAELVSEGGQPVSPATVRRERHRLRIPPKRRRRPPRYHRRRERAARRGALVLMDGSPFPWFTEKERYSLLGAVDDATGEILALHLRPTEDLHGYVQTLHDVIRHHGVPLAIYGDRSSILIRNDRYWTLREELEGQQRPTQFGCILQELGVRFVAATSPQAKGRIERVWGTLQDRLAVELRLRQHHTLAAAQSFLPQFIARHNRRWAAAAQDPVSAFERPPRDLAHILGCRYHRRVARDNTVSIPGRWIQIPPGPHRRSWHPATVEVRELLDGRLLVVHKLHGVIAQQLAPAGPFVLESRFTHRARARPRENGLVRSPQIRDRPAPRPNTRPRSRGIGTLTNIRRPRPDNPFRKWLIHPEQKPLRRKARAGG
jgi:transposase